MAIQQDPYIASLGQAMTPQQISNQQQPISQSATPSAQMPSPAAPLAPQGTASPLYNQNAQAGMAGSVAPVQPTQAPTPTQPAQTTSSSNQQQTTPTQPNTAPQGAPNANLQPGSRGQDVLALQNYLVDHGYLTPQNIATGPGVYGPQTTAAVAKMQQDLGINPGQNAGYYGPQTQQALAQKYQNAYASASGATPLNAAEASSAIDTSLTNKSSDPVFGSVASMMEPIMNTLTQVLTNINNPALTAVSLQQESQQVLQQLGLPQMRTDMMNIQNIMNGTEQDIRDEVSKTGGLATDSQVQALTATRNKVILKQYNALATQYSAAMQNYTSMMQYAAQDQQTALQREQMTASITTSMASIQSQMMQMGLTMQNNARSAAQNAVSNMGYTGLAASAQGNPQMLNYYENVLGLAPGSLSNPQTLATMDTYKQQQLQLNNYKAAIQAYSAGYMSGFPINSDPLTSSNPGGAAQGIGTQAVSSGQLISPQAASNNDILSTTGLSLLEFNYLTQGTSALSRLSQGQRIAINNSVSQWAKDHNVDVSTIQSQYEAYNKTLQSNISRFNNTKVAEGEVVGTLQNLDPAATSAGLGSVNLANVAKILVGQNVNDPKANEYAFYFHDLQNSLAYFYAAQQGNSSADDAQRREAAQVIVDGLSHGGVQGLSAAINSTTKKMETVLGQAVDSSQQGVWNLLGVGDKYHTSNVGVMAKGTMSDSQFVEQTLTSQGLKYDQILAKVPAGKIAVIDNKTGKLQLAEPTDNLTGYTRL